MSKSSYRYRGNIDPRLDFSEIEGPDGMVSMSEIVNRINNSQIFDLSKFTKRGTELIAQGRISLNDFRYMVGSLPTVEDSTDGAQTLLDEIGFSPTP